VAPLSDDALQRLLRTDPARGWRSFIDQYTPLILGLIRRAGVHDRDEMMEVYVLLCEQLSARGFERLRSQHAARGSIGGWLAVVARHAVVDWVRSQKGRRRLFRAVQELSPFERRVFELYYWQEHSPSAIAEAMACELGGEPDLPRVFAALEAVDAVLTDRHRAELLTTAARGRVPSPIDESDEPSRVADPATDPETAARVAQLNVRFEHALASLPAEDAAIIRLKFIGGLSNGDVERALGICELTSKRLQAILASLRASLERLGVGGGDVAFGGRLSLDRSEP